MNTTATATYGQAAGFENRVPRFDIARRFREWRSYRNTVNALTRLSDHQLWDLGLSRADIPDAVAKMLRDSK